MLKKLLISAVITLPGILVYQAFANDTSTCFPYLLGPLNKESLVTINKKADKSRTYMLPAIPATTQWGVFDNSQKPVLTVKPGDSIAIETMAASDNQVVPGATIEQIMKIQHAVEGRGPHTVTGPIYIEGAEPGDVLKIRINKIIPRSYASNNTGYDKGLFPKEFSVPYVRYYYLDIKNKRMQFAPNIVVPLAPFPGVIAVARKEPGKYNTAQPGTFGGNMDLREMTEGSIVYLPVFVKGALFWTGDSHAGQGNGEIDLTAIETAFQEFNITVDLIKNKPLTWPRVETKSAWIAVGYDENLNTALSILKDETIKLIMEKRNVSQEQAKKIMLETWNCPIAEVVNGVKGIYCMIPKNVAAKAEAFPKSDNDKFFVTSASDTDIEKSISKASMDMINKLVNNKKITREDAYTLASFTLDCRVAPHQTGDKTVYCMIAKNLWTD